MILGREEVLHNHSLPRFAAKVGTGIDGDRLVDVLGREIRTYEITYIARERKLEQIEAVISECKLNIIRRRRLKVGENLLQGSWELRGALARHNRFSDIMLSDEDIVGLRY